MRAVLLVAGIGAVATSAPVVAAQRPPNGAATVAPSASSARALALLDTAARTSRRSAWSGLQEVTTWRSGTARTALVAIAHDPASGSVVTSADDPQAPPLAVPAEVLDERVLDLLGRNFDLSVAGVSPCAGHAADVVEARRRDVTGGGGVAARFWVDRTTGIVLRRDVLDDDGQVVIRTAFTRLDALPKVSGTGAQVAAVSALRPSGRRIMSSELAGMATGAPAVLPGGMQLFETRLHDDRVLQLSYSDGLSTLSVFVQPGSMPAAAGEATRVVEQRADREVLTVPGSLERLAWSGSGSTWTLVSDAPRRVVDEALGTLPHAADAPRGDAVGARAWRGLSRVGSWLNPFH